MRQQTIYAVEQYIKRQAKIYADSCDVHECIHIVLCANELTPLIEALGLAKEY